MPSFITAGCWSSAAHDAVLILSDFEPDDVVALKLLAPRLKGVKLLLVVGEGDTDKRQLGAGALACYGLDATATVVQGPTTKIAYPSDAFASFPAEHGAKIAPADADATAMVESFLMDAEAPFALVLKPPHELTGVSAEARAKTACAMYGSFNLSQYRSHLGAADEDAAWVQQEQLLSSFKQCLLIERSSSVGRDATVDSASGDMWTWLAGDAALMGVLEGWNRVTMVNHSKAIATMGESIAQAMAGGGGSSNSNGEAAYSEVGETLAKVDKKVAILSSIVEYKGRQCCLADPLVAVAIADVEALLTPYVVRCTLGHKKGRAGMQLTHTPDPTSSISMLVGQDAAQQKQVLADVRRALAALAREAGAP